MKSIAVVGGSLAGLSTVRALRAEGYDGSITVIGEERHHPYDRPPLSKGFLKGGLAAEALALGSSHEYADLSVHWLLGERAVRLDPAARTVTLTGGRELRTDAVVIATGARPRTIAGAEKLAGVHTLRTLDDAMALRTDLHKGLPRVVVIGAGFIGAEVAATAHAVGLDVTVVEAAEVPLERALGREMGLVCAALHADHGVRLLCGTGVAGLTGEGRVTGVRLTDGRVLPADVVVVGIGVRPATGWLAGSGIAVDDGVVCDAGCATNIPGVVAVGDVARCPNPFTGRSERIEHWTNATEQPKTAARTLLSGTSAPAPTRPPYFWSDQYQARIQLAGQVRPDAQPRVVEGDLDSRSFVAVYRRHGHDVAVLAVDRPKLFNRLRRTLTPIPVATAPVAS
ncbi:3-phenylpropionate/trans-cinnamate dioxygenase ferredoxin reductase subunit [Kitasatospora sp. GAS204A]|uniref:NAD(P)/FAD-dependent oxidoreductase n=1 Tax=unclassified Kitasatospora TaxID=2633591 RepID=UPI0024757E4B|nr:FAD-dependent oxidoreductase [Kitasatospora sp. GAS204B]MDH6119189.1 3-phenylpropionate/trans-cinnamate dioxygenase ferredoxin reductase subunit [Kitasatospora sp. GAS204B]